jgi:hypothetical protein
VDERGGYLLQRYAISYLTSGRDLLRMQVPRGRADLRSSSRTRFLARTPQRRCGRARTPPPRRGRALLRAAGRHRRGRPAITGALSRRATLLTGRLASKSALLKSPGAAHPAHRVARVLPPDGGSGVAGNPLLRSGLALAGANLSGGQRIPAPDRARGVEPQPVGHETRDAVGLRHRLGEVRNGEGVYGLRRAFVVAGSETQVMSLWPVSDAVSRETMVGYYTALRAGLGRGDRAAPGQALAARAAVAAAPYYWASFIQSGEWGGPQRGRADRCGERINAPGNACVVKVSRARCDRYSSAGGRVVGFLPGR